MRSGKSKIACSLGLPSRTNADDRLPLASLGPVEGGDGVVEGRDVADVRPQSSVTHPLDDLIQLGAIGLDNEVDRKAVGGPFLDRAGDGHQCSACADQAWVTALWPIQQPDTSVRRVEFMPAFSKIDPRRRSVCAT